MRAIVLGFGLILGTPAMGAEQFDLVCAGKYDHSASFGSKAGQRVYRIDLNARVWCIEDCSVVLPLVAVTDAAILFQSYERYGMTVEHSVNRNSGRVDDLDFNGVCQPAPFTEIPHPHF